LDQARVLGSLRETGALLEGHFELSSGLHSDRYFQCARVLQHPARAEELARALARRLEELLEEPCEVVVGPALGAVTWAHEVARALGVRGMFTERREGRMELRRGFELAPKERVLIVEDVVTTGGSARETAACVRAAGARPVAVGAIVDRSGRNPFEDLGLPLCALAAVEAGAWKPDACPLCAAGRPVEKPGSRGAARPPVRGAAR
jgi:orotate phosphoribosyltransferase